MLDYLIVPVILIVAFLATELLIQAGGSPALISTVVVGAAVVAAAILERIRPEREEYRRLDQPLVVEAAHFLFNYNLGYVVASSLIEIIGRTMRESFTSLWPVTWPIPLQIATAIILVEGTGYWQHRLVHRIEWLWPFHALHHTGSRLNLIRAGRFHFVDSVTAALTVFLPLALLGAPEVIFIWTIVIIGTLGVLQHANARMRMPAWLDGLICTPAVHRLHHSSDPREGGANFGTSVMLFDRLFGTYLAPDGPGPKTVGIENDPVRAGFLRQTFDPFRSWKRSRQSA